MEVINSISVTPSITELPNRHYQQEFRLLSQDQTMIRHIMNVGRNRRSIRTASTSATQSRNITQKTLDMINQMQAQYQQFDQEEYLRANRISIFQKDRTPTSNRAHRIKNRTKNPTLRMLVREYQQKKESTQQKTGQAAQQDGIFTRPQSTVQNTGVAARSTLVHGEIEENGLQKVVFSSLKNIEQSVYNSDEHQKSVSEQFSPSPMKIAKIHSFALREQYKPIGSHKALISSFNSNNRKWITKKIIEQQQSHENDVLLKPQFAQTRIKSAHSDINSPTEGEVKNHIQEAEIGGYTLKRRSVLLKTPIFRISQINNREETDEPQIESQSKNQKTEQQTTANRIWINTRPNAPWMGAYRALQPDDYFLKNDRTTSQAGIKHAVTPQGSSRRAVRPISLQMMLPNSRNIQSNQPLDSQQIQVTLETMVTHQSRNNKPMTPFRVTSHLDEAVGQRIKTMR